MRRQMLLPPLILGQLLLTTAQIWKWGREEALCVITTTFAKPPLPPVLHFSQIDSHRRSIDWLLPPPERNNKEKIGRRRE